MTTKKNSFTRLVALLLAASDIEEGTGACPYNSNESL
jgi:hypothetical protein